MVTRIDEGLWHIDCRTFDRPNVYLVDDGDYTLVDAGHPRDEDTVRTAIDEVGIGLADIDRILLTHYDADHVGTLGRLTPDLNAPLFIHPSDAPYVAGERLPPWTGRKGLETIHRLYYRRLDLPDLPLQLIQDKDEIGDFSACHTPGHTPGHMVYFHQGVDAVFLGDLAFNFKHRLRPSGWLSSYDVRQVGESIRRVLHRMPTFEHACPGHGRPMTDGHEQLAATIE